MLSSRGFDETKGSAIYQTEAQKEEQGLGENKELSFENTELELNVLLIESVVVKALRSQMKSKDG